MNFEKMRADRLAWRVSNVFIAGLVAGLLWFLFHDYAHDGVFGLIWLWVMRERSIICRLGELSARVALNNSLIHKVLDDLDSSLDALDEHGLYEDADDLEARST